MLTALRQTLAEFMKMNILVKLSTLFINFWIIFSWLRTSLNYPDIDEPLANAAFWLLVIPILNLFMVKGSVYLESRGRFIQWSPSLTTAEANLLVSRCIIHGAFITLDLMGIKHLYDIWNQGFMFRI